MKKYLLILLIVLIFTGCSQIKENNYIDDLPEPEYTLDIDEGRPQTITPSLYYVNLQTGKLDVESRNLIIPEGMAVEEVIIRTMLVGPSAYEFYIPCEGLDLDYIEKTGSLLNVYLTGKQLSDSERFYSACCISESVIEYTSVNYVSVFFNGSSLSINGDPVGPLSRIDADVESLYKELTSRYSSDQSGGRSSTQVISVDVPLYFPSNDGRYILSEVRNVILTKGSYVQGILSELVNGPKYNFSLLQSMKNDASWIKDIETEYDRELRQLTIHTDHNPFYNEGYIDMVDASSVFYSIAGLIPDVNSLILDTGDSGQIFLTRSNTRKYLGNSITIFTADSSLRSVRSSLITIECQNAHLLTRRMRALLEYYDSETQIDISPEALIGISLDGSICIVNLKKAFYDSIGRFNDQQISVLLQSFVNTLVQDSRIKSVLFLCDGERIDLIGDNLHLMYPIIPNVGIIN
ncbi:MAG: GerMN domain-containing protein [Clostridia bacterium]|nr:GerMN domain-containing protein [Clostridia bacterium]